ncbi:MAG TPA: dCTP deaminase [Methanomassiliicoccales archaeon]|jgi:dCTP deaminase|nr:dCTP deaminase [Methanomassiliicoccales archaeon]
MCILADHEILARLRDGSLVITEFAESSLTPNGYDLRIAELSVPDEDKKYSEGTATIPPGGMFFVCTIEHIELPDDLAAQLWTRTTWIRKGLLMGLGKIDAGFHGQLTFSGFNASSKPVEFPIGSRMVQMCFETMHSKVDMTYEKRSGNYQGQKGITLAPLAKDEVN